MSQDKQCYFDCVYCPLGRTKTKVSRTIPSPNLIRALEEIKSVMQNNPVNVVMLDPIGDPLLYNDLEQYAELAHEYGAAFAVESIGYGFNDPVIRNNLKSCDELHLEIQDTSAEMFRKLHRPAEGITYEALKDGYMHLRDWYQGKLSVKAFLINRYNDTPEDVMILRQITTAMKPDHLSVNTLNEIPKLKAFHIDEKRAESLKAYMNPEFK